MNATDNKLCVSRRPGELPRPLKAIRSRCLDCCCGQSHEVALCTCTSCALWPWRFGTRKAALVIVAEESGLGEVEGEYWAERLPSYGTGKSPEAHERART